MIGVSSMHKIKTYFFVVNAIIQIGLVYYNQTLLQATIAIIGCLFVKTIFDWSE